ncbi:hypothetical protein HII31_01064, partial [Pseudocercospora fuligena]
LKQANINFTLHLLSKFNQLPNREQQKLSEFESLRKTGLLSQYPMNEELATEMEEQLKLLERGRKENIKSHMEDMTGQVDWITSQVSALENTMAAIEAYGQPPTDDDDFGESASDIVVAATRKRRRDEHDDPEPVVASEQEVAYVQARDRNFEMSFVRSESPACDTSRTARSETFGREDDDDEHQSKRQRSDDQESISDGWISDEELNVGEPVYPGHMQVSDEHVPAPVEVGEWYSYPSPMQVSNQQIPAPVDMREWFQRPVRSAGMQSPEIFLDTGFAQSLLPPLPLSRQEVFEAQFEGEMTGELLADYPLAQHTIEAEHDAPSGSVFTSFREDTQDISGSIEKDTLPNGTKPDCEDQSEQEEAVASDAITEQPANLEDLASYYERVAYLARQPAVVLYVRDAFTNFRVHKDTHPNSQITATDVRQKLRFILEREAMVPAVQDWLTYPLPVALISSAPVPGIAPEDIPVGSFTPRPGIEGTVRWSIYGRHTCSVEEESESDLLQQNHLGLLPLQEE